MGYFRKILTNARISFLKFHVSERDYNKVRPEILTSNRKIFLALSFILLILFFLLFVLSIVTPEPILVQSRKLYLILSLIMLFNISLGRFLSGRYDFFVLPFCYLFLLAINFYSIAVGIYKDPTQYAVAFSATIFIAPVLFVERTHRMNIFSTVMELLFITLSFYEKSRSTAMMDFLNSICFWMLSCFLCAYLNHIRISDILLRKSIQTEADFDVLTSVLKKSSFVREVQRFLHGGRSCGTLFIIDIDNFKNINDTYGHMVGDKIISSIALCIKKTFRTSDLIGRFGGDEFIVFMPNNLKEKMAAQKSENVINLVKNTVFLPDSEKSATVSVGSAVTAANSEKYETLFMKADAALYKAKQNGKCTYEIFK